jgi:hypothetical protein
VRIFSLRHSEANIIQRALFEKGNQIFSCYTQSAVRIFCYDMKSISISDKTFARAAKLAEVFGISTSECIERLLNRFAFEPLARELNVNVAVEAQEIICGTRSDAKALANRLESFATQTRKQDATEPLIRASAVKYNDGWGVKTVCSRNGV